MNTFHLTSDQGLHYLQKQFSHFSLGIPKSHCRMYLKWTDKNLVSLTNSLSLWKALSLYPHANMICLLQHSHSRTAVRNSRTAVRNSRRESAMSVQNCWYLRT